MEREQIHKIIKVYDPTSIPLLNALLGQAYEQLQSCETKHEVLQYYAMAAYRTSLLLQRLLGVDLCTLSFPLIEPPLPDDHPMMVALKGLDKMIGEGIKDIGADPSTNIIASFYGAAQLWTSLVWKGYLFCLFTAPKDWGPEDLCALACLRILSTVSGPDVIQLIEKTFKETIGDPKAEDWPPRGFINLWFANRDRLKAISSYGF